MSTLKIDINCDLGESVGNKQIGNDEAIFPYLSSCNIACGFHGGDALTIERTIDTAKKYGVRVGAHPSYPDAHHFGRKAMNIPYKELKAILKYQIAALKGMVESKGIRLEYVKPHGALYNSAADHQEEAIAIIDAVREIDDSLDIMGLPGGVLHKLTHSRGMTFIPEAFADRRYQDNGRLVSRKLKNAVILDGVEAARQVLDIILHREVNSIDQNKVSIEAHSICVHGDNPKAIEILKAIDSVLKTHNILKTADLGH